jgi:hypothetical protein
VQLALVFTGHAGSSRKVLLPSSRKSTKDSAPGRNVMGSQKTTPAQSLRTPIGSVLVSSMTLEGSKPLATTLLTIAVVAASIAVAMLVG